MENAPKTSLSGSIPYSPSENFGNTSENSRTKLENHIDEKYDQLAINYLKEKILNEVKQQFSSSNQGSKINAELVKRLREQIENLQREISFYAKK